MSEPWQRAAREGRRVGHRIEAHDRIGSTNDRARELLDADDGDGVAVVADEQSAGRGRRGRGWLTPPGTNLALSLALRPRIAATDGWQLGLGTAVAAADACSEFAPVELKWPNDLVTHRGRKLGGILAETIVDGDGIIGAVIGIGINVNWRRDAMPAEIAGAATSLADVAGRPVNRVALLGRLLEELDRAIVAIEGGTSPLEAYRRRCATLGSWVTVATGREEVNGRAVDLDASGALVVEVEGERRALTTGEVVRVRGRGAVPA